MVLLRKRLRKLKKPLKVLLMILLVAYLVFAAYKSLYYVGVNVIGTSMEPTLQTDAVGYTRKVSNSTNFHYGDIVVVEAPDADYLVIKRIIGLPYDTIELKAGTLYRNGQLIDESYLPDSADADLTILPEVTLLPDEVFIAGDNRTNSKDSRDYGPIKITNIKGIGFEESKVSEIIMDAKTWLYSKVK